MTVTEDTPFSPEDDTYHVATDDRYWTETTWWSLNIPERRMGAWLHAGYHTNRGTVTWRVFLWDPTGADPGRLAYYRNSGEVPMPAGADLRDLQFPEGGFGVKMLTPLMDYHITFADAEADFGIEFEHRSVHPPRRFTPGEAPAMHNPHLDQLGRLTGAAHPAWRADSHRLLLGPGPHLGASRRPPLPEPEDRVCPGRDASRLPWRPSLASRSNASGGGAGSSTSSATPTTRPAFSASSDRRTATPSGWSPMNVGWLLRDGVFQRLDKTKSRMRNFRDPITGWSAHMEVDMTDVTGRHMEAEGFTVSHMCENAAGSNALMRWEYDGKVGWGEDQDGWRVDHFQKMLRALRAVR